MADPAEPIVCDDEVTALRAQNAALRAKVEGLRRENHDLRGRIQAMEATARLRAMQARNHPEGPEARSR